MAIAAPVEVSVSGTSGSSALSVMPGYTGTLTAAARGLAQATSTPHNLTGAETNFNTSAPAPGPAVAKLTVTVPAGSRLTRFATYDSDYPAGTDIDLFVYNQGSSTLRFSSAGGTAEESVTTTATGSFDIYVVLFAQPGGATGPVHRDPPRVRRAECGGREHDRDAGQPGDHHGRAGHGDGGLERPGRR